MELAELKHTWIHLKSSIEEQKSLNQEQIMEIVQSRYKRKLGSIIRYESYGVIVILIGLVFTIWNIPLYDTLALQICAALSIGLMILLPTLSFTTIFRMRDLNMANQNTQDTIREFAKRRAQFLIAQQWGLWLSAVFMFTLIPVATKIFKGKDILSEGSNTLPWIMVAGLVFLFFFGRWGLQCYRRISADAGNLLQELEE